MLRSEEKGRVLLLTSSVPKEGKSFVSINLAISFALSGRKTALVEFDLYRPAVCTYLGVAYDHGISDFFMGRSTFAEICQPYDKVESLWIVPAGTLLVNPAELILNGKLPALVSSLKNEFDTIIIDSPCVGMVTDPKILAPYSSVSLYVIRQNYTHHGFIKFMNELKETGNMPNLRIVYNGIRIKKAPGLDYWDSYGYNGFRYGHKNGYTKKKVIKEHRKYEQANAQENRK
jgi:capsular exopolysaccharide synthesis family protein